MIECSKVDRIYLPYTCGLLLVLMAFAAAYVGHSITASDTQGIRWITVDREGRLLFTMDEEVYRGRPEGPFTRLIETGLPGHGSVVTDVAVAPDGRIFLSDSLQRKVRVFTDTGAPVGVLSEPFCENAKLAADTNHLYVADMQGNRVVALDSRTGAVIWERQGYQIPDDISCAGNVVVVSDLDRKIVEIIDADTGGLIATLAIKDESPFLAGSTVLALPGKNEILLTGNWYLMRYSFAGELRERIPAPRDSWLIDMAVAPDGGIFIPDPEGCRLWVVKNKAFIEVKNQELDRLLAAKRQARAELSEQAEWFLAGILVLLGGVVFLLVMFARARAAAGLTAKKPAASPAPVMTPAERKQAFIGMVTLFAAIYLISAVPFVPLKRLYILLLIVGFILHAKRFPQNSAGFRGIDGRYRLACLVPYQWLMALVMVTGMVGMMIVVLDWFFNNFWSVGLTAALLPLAVVWLMRWLRRQSPKPGWFDRVVVVSMGGIFFALAPVGFAGIVWWTAVGLTPVPEPQPAIARPVEPTPATMAFDQLLDFAIRESNQLPAALTTDTVGIPDVPQPVVESNRERLREFRKRFALLQALEYYSAEPLESDDSKRGEVLVKFFRAIGGEAKSLLAEGRTAEAVERIQFLTESGYRCLHASPSRTWLPVSGHIALATGGKAMSLYLRATRSRTVPPQELRTMVARIHGEPLAGWDQYWWSLYWEQSDATGMVNTERIWVQDGDRMFAWLPAWVFRHYIGPAVWDGQRIAQILEEEVRADIRSGEYPYPQVVATLPAVALTEPPISFWNQPTNFFGQISSSQQMQNIRNIRLRVRYRWEVNSARYRALALALAFREAVVAGRDPRVVWTGLPTDERLNPLTGKEITVDWRARELTAELPRCPGVVPPESFVVPW